RRRAGGRRAGAFPLGRSALGRARVLQLAGSVARLLYGNNGCLRQSLLRLWLLAGEGENAELVVGVCRDPREPFAGHTWVECNGVVVDDVTQPERRFAVLTRY